MKLNVIKALISLGVSVVLGLLCFEIAKETDYRNWIGLAITTISVSSKSIYLVSKAVISIKRGYKKAKTV